MNEPRHQTPDPDLLRRILARACAGRRYSEADLFAERKSTLRIDLLDGRVIGLVSGLEEGAAVRTAGPAGCRFAHSGGLDEASLCRLATGEAVDSSDGAAHPGLEPSVPESLVQALGHVGAEAGRGEPPCQRVEVSCYAACQQVWILDESGHLAMDQRSAFRVSARVLTADRWGAAHHGGAWTDTIFDLRQARHLARHARSAALTAAGARPVPAGEQTVVLAAGSGGILLHEACGHLLEADYIIPGLSPYAGRLGQAVASPLVSAVDDPTLPDLPASQMVDDEGVPTTRKLLLDQGIIAAFLCGRREAGGGAGFQPGNGRRRSFRHLPLPRMSNTMILSGETPPKEIIRRTGSGIYAARLSAGQADPASGRFRFTVAQGRLIEDGKLTWPLDGAVISGTGPAALSAVDLVGNDARVDATAAGCTKAGQTIPVSVGHPTLRIRTLTVEPLGSTREGQP